MTRRQPCPPAPGPLEGYAARFDDLFGSLAQRRGFREYLAGLLAPRDRNKTLTALAGAEPVAGAQHRSVPALPYTPARHFAKGKADPGFRTKLAIGADLAARAREAGFVFRAVCADSAYGDQDGFRGELAEAGLPFVMALKPRHGTWAYGPDAHTPADAARTLAWGGPDDPGDWQAVTRTFRDGRTETWWAADARPGWWGPDRAT